MGNPELQIGDLEGTVDAGQRLGLTGKWVRQLMQDGLLRSVRLGYQWYVSRADVDALLARGRPYRRPWATVEEAGDRFSAAETEPVASLSVPRHPGVA